MTDRLRELLDPASSHQLELPPDPQLKTELLSARFGIKNNKLVVYVAARQWEKAKAVLLAVWQDSGVTDLKGLIGGFHGQ